MTATEIRQEAQRVASTMSNDQVETAFIVAMQDGETQVAKWMMEQMVTRGMVKI